MMTDREILVARARRHRAAQPQPVREVLSWEQWRNLQNKYNWRRRYERLTAPEHAPVGEE